MNAHHWYAGIQAWANRYGAGEPRLLIDMQRFTANCAMVASYAQRSGKQIRLVQKSLPCEALLREAAGVLGTQRLMIFHRPYLNSYAKLWPDCDMLLGKPMPASAAAQFYAELPEGNTFVPQHQLQWLIDSDARLIQYQQLAHKLGVRMRINIEIDVGMHRGGLSSPQQLTALLQRISEDPEHLEFSGLMGYDAHAAKAPFWSNTERALQNANARYRDFCTCIQRNFPALWHADLCLNGAGSPTFTLHLQDSPLNEVSLGSCLVKPSDFDLPGLRDFVPAMLITTPALKVSESSLLPYLEGLQQLIAALKIPGTKALFIYGGKWMAHPVWPLGLKPSKLYGRSSNQEMLTAPMSTPIEVDSNVLLRPTQSEALMLQFGTLLIRQPDQGCCSWQSDDPDATKNLSHEQGAYP